VTLANSAMESMVVPALPSAVNRTTAASTIAARVDSAYSSRRLLTSITLEAIRAVLGTRFEHPESIADEVLLGFFAGFAAVERAAAVQDYVAGMEPSEMVGILEGLASFTRPVAIVWATDDVFFPVAWAEWLETTIPGVTRSVRVAGARLFFPLERPDELTRELRQFWGSVAA